MKLNEFFDIIFEVGCETIVIKSFDDENNMLYETHIYTTKYSIYEIKNYISIHEYLNYDIMNIKLDFDFSIITIKVRVI